MDTLVAGAVYYLAKRPWAGTRPGAGAAAGAPEQTAAAQEVPR